VKARPVHEALERAQVLGRRLARGEELKGHTREVLGPVAVDFPRVGRPLDGGADYARHALGHGSGHQGRANARATPRPWVSDVYP
jgi:hypothetical protein